MLGIGKPNDRWFWTAVGKHAAAADYIQLSGGSPLMEALSAWVTKGYQTVVANAQAPRTHYSWRFWLGGADRRTLLCGLICDSSDRIGRPFPFALIGEGKIKGWEQFWPWLPLGLDTTWAALEYVAAHHFEDIKALRVALQRVSAPDLETLQNQGNMGGANGGGNASTDGMQAVPMAEQGLDQGRLVYELSNSQIDPRDQVAGILSKRFEPYQAHIPRAVFLGGTPLQTYLVVLVHPLRSADFVALWNL